MAHEHIARLQRRLALADDNQRRLADAFVKERSAAGDPPMTIVSKLLEIFGEPVAAGSISKSVDADLGRSGTAADITKGGSVKGVLLDLITKRNATQAEQIAGAAVLKHAAGVDGQPLDDPLNARKPSRTKTETRGSDGLTRDERIAKAKGNTVHRRTGEHGYVGKAAL
jgi:hypothetical protein